MNLEKVCELPLASRVFFHPEKNILATYDKVVLPSSRLVRVWKIDSGELLNEVEMSSLINCFSYGYSPSEICFSRDLNTIVVGSQSCVAMDSIDPREIHLIEVATGVDLGVFPGPKSDIRSIAISPDDRHIASGTWANEIKIWDLLSRKEVATLEANNGSVDALAFSPDGSVLASGSGMNEPLESAERASVIVWNTSSWTKMFGIKFGSHVHSLHFSPDARVLAVGGGLPYMEQSSARLKTYDRESGNLIRTLIGGPDVLKDHQCVEGVSFHPSGDLLASGSDDHLLRLWDLHSGEKIAEVDMKEHIYDVAFSPNGSFLAATAQQARFRRGKTLVWKVGLF